MRHVVVPRVALGISLALVAASLLFARARSAGSRSRPFRIREDASETIDAGLDRVAGERLFQRHCASCHTIEELSVLPASDRDRGLAVLEMLEFLGEHGASNAAEDRRILVYLLARSPRTDSR